MLAGMYFPGKCYLNSKNDIKLKWTIRRFYCTLMVLCVFGALIKASFLINKISGEFDMTQMLLILTVSWNYLVFSEIYSIFRGFSLYNGYSKFCAVWSEIFESTLQCPIFHKNLRSIKYTSRVVCIIATIAFVCNFAYVLYQIFEINGMDFMLYPLEPNRGSRAFLAALSIVNSSAWILPIGFHAIICLIVYKAFETLNDQAREVIKYHNTECFGTRIEEIRQRYEKCCELVAAADTMLCFVNATCFVLNVLNACLTLYILIYDDKLVSTNILAKVGVYFWLITALVSLLVMCSSSAVVHESVSFMNLHPEKNLIISYFYFFHILKITITSSTEKKKQQKNHIN